MPFEMIDGDEGFVGGQRDRLARGQPDHDAADQAGTGGGGDGVDVVERAARLVQRAADQMVERIDMGARGDFRHDAAIGRMFGDLAQDGVGQNVAAPGRIGLDDSGGGFVAGASRCRARARRVAWELPPTRRMAAKKC